MEATAPSRMLFNHKSRGVTTWISRRRFCAPLPAKETALAVASEATVQWPASLPYREKLRSVSDLGGEGTLAVGPTEGKY